MITSSQALHEMIRNKFEIKDITHVSASTLMIGAREEKLAEITDFLIKECDARLVSIFSNDFINRMDLLSVFQLNHVKIKVLVRRGIDAGVKKAQSIMHLSPNAKFLERYQSRFLGIDFILPPGTEMAVADAYVSVPWTGIDLNEGIDGASFHACDGIFNPVVNAGSYIWSKNRQMQVRAVKVQPGHAHRGILKFSETMPPVAIPFVIARACWKDKFHSVLACCMALEEASGIEGKIPHVAQCWRLVGCELERLVNHHRFISSWMKMAGLSHLANQNLDLVQDLVALQNKLLGVNDVTPFVAPGGITFDPFKDGRLTASQLDEFLHEYEESFSSMTTTPVIKEGIFSGYSSKGIVPSTELMKAGISGPFLRASGVQFDTRVDFPYDLYKTGLLRWDTCVLRGGDIQSRVEIHVHEMMQSLRLLFQTLSLLKEVPGNEILKVETPAATSGEGTVVVESPRGETHAYVRLTEDGKNIHTLRLFPASFGNIHGLECIMPRMGLKELPAFVQSFNPCWTCLDM